MSRAEKIFKGVVATVIGALGFFAKRDYDPQLDGVCNPVHTFSSKVNRKTALQTHLPRHLPHNLLRNIFRIFDHV